MRLLVTILVVVATFFLIGCAELGARFVTDAAYLAESSEAFVREVHDDRRWIRTECREMLRAEVEALRRARKFAEARRFSQRAMLPSASRVRSAFPDWQAPRGRWSACMPAIVSSVTRFVAK